MNDEAYAGDDQHHHAGKRIEQHPPVGDKAHHFARARIHRPGGHPLEQDFLEDTMLGIGAEQLQYGAQRENEGQQHAADAQHAYGAVLQTPSNEQHQSR